jgi:hypothetical protein
MYNHKKMVNDNIKIVMIAAINEAIKIKKQKPYADAEDIMPSVLMLISNFSKRDDSRLGAIAAVNSTIKYMNKNPGANEKEIFQFILDNSSEIINTIQQTEQ